MNLWVLLGRNFAPFYCVFCTKVLMYKESISAHFVT